ncbi:hypothetical protein PPERSA_05659 [Pseudocohnilembus persalinus]|uniref:Uncharacterized protein n=1 Tax=Pseudocohnilembus persalinus TaxID=266149 RepID=A0A0V0QPY6_PSEPJ|nr:hypothetical protein PPERSA_05659 [Pseudocohnilembus persalinus]|eukprot:KRX04398.1 hypothetical protein PPERSA_05659 [Pseudocohnilembus persalinus]
MSETKLLPIFLTFQRSKQTSYLVSKDIIRQFIDKQPVFKQHQLQNEIKKERNLAIKQFNKEAIEYNQQNQTKIQYYGWEKKELLKEIPINEQLEITDTTDLKFLQSLKYPRNPTFWTRFSEDVTIQNLLKTIDLIESTFESLPMLIVQLINNNYLGTWSNLAIFSMSLSLTMTFINAIQIGLSVFQQNIMPQVQFYRSVEKHPSERKDDVQWLFGKYRQCK